MSSCTACGKELPKDDFDEPTVDSAFVSVKWNPRDDPLVDEVRGDYCSLECAEDDLPEWVQDEITMT